MFNSHSQPIGCPRRGFDSDWQGYDPADVWGFQRLAVSEVAKFLDARGIGTDYANELFAVAKTELDKHVELVEVVEADGSSQFWPHPYYDRLTKPVEYVRKCVQQAIVEYWQKDHCVFIPPSTRRDLKNRLVEETGDWWAEPNDPKNHSWDSVFNGENLRPVNCEEGSATGVQPHWQQPIDPASYLEKRKEIVETLALLYSLCRDQTDRDIIDLRFLNLRPVAKEKIDDDADELLMSEVVEQSGNAGVKQRLNRINELIDSDVPMRPANVADVAEQLGLSVNAVKERLGQLEQRYYRLLDVRLPTKKRTQRPRGRTSLAS